MHPTSNYRIFFASLPFSLHIKWAKIVTLSSLAFSLEMCTPHTFFLLSSAALPALCKLFKIIYLFFPSTPPTINSYPVNSSGQRFVVVGMSRLWVIMSDISLRATGKIRSYIWQLFFFFICLTVFPQATTEMKHMLHMNFPIIWVWSNV